MVMDKVTTAIEKIIDDGLGSKSETEVETETKQEQSESPDRESNVDVESDEEIKVGDRVNITDCPGHWSWASPFIVKSIKGNWVKLEMVSEPVEIEKLFVING